MRYALLLIVMLVGGCHVYRPLVDVQPAAGARLAVQLTDSGAVVLAREIGPAADIVEGDLLRADDRSLVLSVRLVRLRGGLTNEWAGEPVTIDRALIASLAERRTSRARSVLFAGGIVASAVLAATKLSGLVGGGGSGRSGPGGER